MTRAHLDRLHARRAAWADRGLHRTLRPPAGVDLTSNDYLGLASHPDVRAALAQALADAATHGGTGSRLLSGHRAAWSAVESAIARWQGAEAALFHSSGYAANLGMLQALVEPDDIVISDRLNHASLIDGIRLTKAPCEVIPHNSPRALDNALDIHRGRTAWVVVESVYSMDGDLAPLADIAAVCRARSAALMVDEAHATGLYGPTGAGRIEELGLRDAVFASVHTCGKALGQSGAFVVSSHGVIDWLVQRSRPFVFSTASPPWLAAGIDRAMQLIQADKRLRLRPRALAERLRAQIRDVADVGRSASHIVPIVIGQSTDAMRCAHDLSLRGWDVRAVRPPTVPEGSSRIRLVLNAGLTDAQVDQLAEDVRAVLSHQQYTDRAA